MKKFWIALLLIGIAVGCGKQEAPQQAAVQEEVAAAPAELPELEQNKLYLNNPIVAGPQDTSFEPVSNEMEEISEEEKALLPPESD